MTKATPCGAKTRNGTPCQLYPEPGHTRCRLHGGATPRAIQAATVRLIKENARMYGEPVDITPHEALVQEIHNTAGHIAWLRAKIDALSEKELTSGVVEQTISDEHGKTIKVKTAPSVWIDLYQRERKHLVEVAAIALRAGVEERVVRVAEQQGELLAQAVRGILTDLNLSEEQQALVSSVVPRHLRAVGGL